MRAFLVVLLVLSLGLNFWMGRTVVRLENFHYGVIVGMCGQYDSRDVLVRVDYLKCLDAEKTRTSPLWHLSYALTE